MFYNKEEELAELQKQFQQKENFFLEAFSEEQQASVGCMGILIRKDEAKTRRWEPLVKEQASFKTVAGKLLEEGLTLLKRRGVKRLETSFKYMLDELSSMAPLLELFNSVGFKEKVPPTKQFYKQLTEQSSEEIDSIEGNVITFKTRSHYSLETFCDLTVQAFSTLEEDKRIHSWDPIVSN
ncbi:MAG: hypothetical protein ACTSV6_04430 [Candidatus Heimdallarchaeota archaeon]